MRKGLHILIVEDNKADVFLIREAITGAGIEAEITEVQDGNAATDVFEALDRDEGGMGPDVVLLDLNLPKKSGFEVLAHMQASRRCGKARVVIVTSSDSARDRAQAQALGAHAYFRKPSDFEEFMKLGDVVAGQVSTGG